MQVRAVSGETCASVSPAVGAPPGKLGFIRVATFNKQTAGLFTEQLRDLNRAGIGALVLDLRNNGGGSFPAGVQVCQPCSYLAMLFGSRRL